MCISTGNFDSIIWYFKGAIYIPFELSDCPSLMLGIAIHCIQHSQAMLECGLCELANSFFYFFQCLKDRSVPSTCIINAATMLFFLIQIPVEYEN